MVSGTTTDGRTSKLWGEGGDDWSPGNRLPDVSCAGYRRGSAPLPDVDVVATVTDYGAVGDGDSDDTEAFRAAITDVGAGAIQIPAGEYRLTDRLRIERSDLVLRGAGREETTLRFSNSLTAVDPQPTTTATGRPTSDYSWSGGFLHVSGSYESTPLAAVEEPAARGDRWLRLASDHGVTAGQRIEVAQTDTRDQTLCTYLYADDPGDISDIEDSARASLVADVRSVDGAWIEIDRPLRFDVRPDWTPTVRRFAPTVTDVGIEDLSITFPATTYDGHFTEDGYNPIAFTDVAHCWLRNLAIRNADSGPMISGRFCTVDGIHFDADRPPSEDGHVGHHGMYLSDDDNLVRDFRFDVTFIHDVTVSKSAGNVVADGSGTDLCLDHHRWLPYANVFTDIDCGAGSRVWASSGGPGRGRHAAAWSTFWNLRAEQPISPPPGDWGPHLNGIAVATDDHEFRTDPAVDYWWEPIDPTGITPQNIHIAQRERRFSSR